MALTSDEVNFLVYRYLRESGFEHSAYAFGHESFVYKSNIDGQQVPPGALISFIQKGLQYVEIEQHIHEDGTETICDEHFSVMKKHTCRVKSRKRIFDLYTGDEGEYGELEIDELVTLKGHDTMVCTLTWHSKDSMLTSGGSDGAIRFWTHSPNEEKTKWSSIAVSDGNGNENEQTNKSKRIKMEKCRINDNTSVVSLDWNSKGTHLASGRYDGTINIYSKTGDLVHTLSHHKAPVSNVRWNPSGSLLLSGGVDSTVAVWEDSTLKYEAEKHQGPILDLDWCTDSMFATAGTDQNIVIHEQQKNKTWKDRTINAHDGEINSVRFDPTGKLLLSASDDRTVKVWNVENDKCIHELRDHDKEVTIARWNNAGPKSAYPTLPLLFASGSADTTVKLWEPVTGKCLFTLAKHGHPISSLAFAPGQNLIATGSWERVFIWSTQDGSLVKTFKNLGDYESHSHGLVTGLNDLAWDETGTKLALAYADQMMYVMDIRV